MSTLSYKKFEDSDSGVLPDKMTVFQDCLQAFNASPVQAKRCRMLLARLLRLLYSGDSFPSTESTTLFFSISKLFQHKDVSLRQMVYLTIKELSKTSEDVLMVTSSIMKDAQNGDITYKPNAIRTLARVLDASTVNATERLFKNSVVDKNQSISSAALISSYHMLPVAKDVVKRWTNETQGTITASKVFLTSPVANHEQYGSQNLSSFIYQYHALGLLYHLRNHDKMALMKMIQSLSSNNVLKHPAALVQLTHYIAKVLETDSSLAGNFESYFEIALQNRSDMVALEAVKTIVTIPALSGLIVKAIYVLDSFLSAPRTVVRFAAVRLLNKISLTNPEHIVVCNGSLESLINDSNRAISTYAITTLLKTGNNDNVDRLIKTIAGFMDDISDEFKIVVIDSIRSLSLKFPEKHKSMLSFLNDRLREEGGFNLKNSIIEAIFDVIKFVPESRESCLEKLCEFIEDCEFTELAVRILHLLGNEGPKTSKPTLYIRHIYNRVVLENSIVRSSAVIALSKFALIGDASINKSISILLTRCLNDVDDEVRDRAALALKLLSTEKFDEARAFIDPGFSYSLPVLEQKLAQYVNGDEESFNVPFDGSNIPKISEDEARAYEYKEKLNSMEESIQKESKQPKEEVSEFAKHNLLQQQYAQELSNIPELAAYGDLLRSSHVVDLTEKETEFVVTCVKHIFAGHIVLQFNVENTLTDLQLDNVTMVSEPDFEEFVEDFVAPIESLRPQTTGSTYVSFTRSETLEGCLFTNNLTYIAKEVDPATGEAAEGEEGFEDEYRVESLDIVPGDFIVPSFAGNFTSVWDSLPNPCSSVFNLSDAKGIAEVVAKLIKDSSMSPCDSSELVGSHASHTLKLFGKSINNENIAAVIRFVYKESVGVMVKVEAKSVNAELGTFFVNEIIV
ncbi:BA75_03083T0 [Komagataella pastoris]|uniref:Coatomer subunit gamma n=1 Tax=Komagataella pastoris TaxID=4922 RepID=A0A1B2JDB5_PICPA|nr:BA75_03083T0 [Komagataella pastoris]